MSVYNAPKPERANHTWFKIILLRILFPPVLLWDLLRIICNALLGGLIGGRILDEMPQHHEKSLREQRKFFLILKDYQDGSNILHVTLDDKAIKTEIEQDVDDPTQTQSNKINLGKFTEKEFLSEKNFNILHQQIENLLSKNPDAIISFTHDDDLIGRLIYQKLSDEHKKRFVYGNDLVFYNDTKQTPAHREIAVYHEKSNPNDPKIRIKYINTEFNNSVSIAEFGPLSQFRYERQQYRTVLACTTDGESLHQLSQDNFPQLYETSLYYNVSKYRRSEDYSICLPEIITHDACQLETMEVKPVVKGNPQPKKYIINFHGRNQSATSSVPHSMKDIIYAAKRLNSTIINFSYRGMGLSTGKARSKDDLVTDGIAQVQRLLDQNVSPEDITLYGHSLGAGVATLVAKYFYRHGKHIKVINDRSFSNLTNVVCGWIKKILAEQCNLPTLGTVLAWLLKPLIKLGVLLIKWEMAVDEAYSVLPEEKKLCFVVKSKKIDEEMRETNKQREAERKADHEASEIEREQRGWQRSFVPFVPNDPEPKREEDGIITHYGSLYRAVKAGGLFFKDTDKKMQNLQKISSINGFDGDGHDLHRSSLHALKTREGKSPFDVMETFIFENKASGLTR